MVKQSRTSETSLPKLVTLVLVMPVLTALVVGAAAYVYRSMSDVEDVGIAVVRPGRSSQQSGMKVTAPVQNTKPKKLNKPKPVTRPIPSSPAPPAAMPLAVAKPMVSELVVPITVKVMPVQPTPVKPVPKPVKPVKLEIEVLQPVQPPQPVKPVKPVPRKKTAPARSVPGKGRFKPTDQEWLIENFEGKNVASWKVQDWGNAALVDMADGLLKLELLGGKNAKTAIGCSIKVNMSSRKDLQLDVVNNLQTPVRLAIAFVGGQGSKYCESMPVQVPPGENPGIKIDLLAKTFKSAQSKWMHKEPLSNVSNVKRIFLLFYTMGKGSIYVDNIKQTAKEIPVPAPDVTQ